MLRIWTVYPGSEIFYPGSRAKKIPDPSYVSASKNLTILTLKTVSKLPEKLSGMFIPDPDFSPSLIRIRDPAVKKVPELAEHSVKKSFETIYMSVCRYSLKQLLLHVRLRMYDVCTVYTVHCTLYIVLYTVQYTMCVLSLLQYSKQLLKVYIS